MKIAVPFEDGQVFQHFGRSAQFKFYEAENGQLLRTEVIPTNGQGHGALTGFLVQHGADVVLCGGIGTGAQVALMQVGIQAVRRPFRRRRCRRGRLSGREAGLRPGHPLHPPRPRRGPQLRLPLRGRVSLIE